MHFCTLGYETPGDGMVAPTRYTAMIISVNRILRRRSGVARAERKALSTRDLLGVTGVHAGERLSRFRTGRNMAWPPGTGKPGTLRGALHPKRAHDSNRMPLVSCTP